MAAAQPVKLKDLVASGFSLDSSAKLPPSLVAIRSSPRLTGHKAPPPSPVNSNNNLGGLAKEVGSLSI